MAWIRLDDGYAEHPKVVGLSDAALAMEIRGLCYVSRRETDGFVPDGSLRLLVQSGVPEEAAAELVHAGRWERDDGRGGYWIHDYLTVNPSKAQRQAKRDAAADRMRRVRSGRRSQDLRANSKRTSREVRDGGDAGRAATPPPSRRSSRVRANTSRTANQAPEATVAPGAVVAVADLPVPEPLSSGDAAPSRNGDRSVAPGSQDVRANSARTSAEVPRNSERSSPEVRGEFATPLPLREPTSGGSLRGQGEWDEGVVLDRPAGPVEDHPLPGTDPSHDWERARRGLVARLLARGEIPKHATEEELAAWRATGRLPWQEGPADPPPASPPSAPQGGPP